MQEPQSNHSPETSLTRFRKVTEFARAVSDTVENTIFAHDRLMCKCFWPAVCVAVRFYPGGGRCRAIVIAQAVPFSILTFV
jgi:hypothetical protein